VVTRGAVAALVIMGACGGGEDPPAEVALTLTFSASETVRSSPNLVDPLAGVIYGSIYRLAEVGVTGPREGAEAVADVEVADVDHTVDTESAAAWSEAPPAPDFYVFLGFFDVDGNHAGSFEPDAGDPVTLATSNDFEVVEGEALDVVVQFDLVFN
jgi:hypothetical protein